MIEKEGFRLVSKMITSLGATMISYDCNAYIDQIHQESRVPYDIANRTRSYF